MKHLKLALVAVLLTSACTGLSPSAKFEQALTDSDRILMEQTAQKALEESKIGQSLNWSNAQNGRRGTVMPIRTYKNNAGQDCREYRQSVTMEGQTRFQNGTRCRQPGGGWVVVRIPAPPYWPHWYEPGYRPYPYHGYPYYPYPHRHYHGARIGFGHRFGYWY